MVLNRVRGDLPLVSALCAISLQYTHLNLTDFFVSSQYPILLVFAVVVATPVCPRRCMCSVIRSDILCSLRSSAGCFSSYETMSLLSLPPTRIIPLSSLKGLRDFIRLCRVFCTCFTQKISAPCSSSGDRGSSFPSCMLLVNQIFSASLRIRAVTQINLRQLENVEGSIASSALTVAMETANFI